MTQTTTQRVRPFMLAGGFLLLLTSWIQGADYPLKFILTTLSVGLVVYGQFREYQLFRKQPGISEKVLHMERFVTFAWVGIGLFVTLLSGYLWLNHFGA